MTCIILFDSQASVHLENWKQIAREQIIVLICNPPNTDFYLYTKSISVKLKAPLTINVSKSPPSR